jgi:hypothetical protein
MRLAVREFPCSPAIFDELVVWFAGQCELVDVGGAAGRPFIDMVHFAHIAGHVAARVGAATVLRVQHDSLIRRRDPAGTTEMQRSAGGVVEDGQVVVRVRCHPDHVAHRQ